MRPIYHYSSEHVKGHVFVYVLSYLLTKLLELKMGKTIKMLREETMSAVIISSKDRGVPDQIIGGEMVLQQCGITV